MSLTLALAPVSNGDFFISVFFSIFCKYIVYLDSDLDRFLTCLDPVYLSAENSNHRFLYIDFNAGCEFGLVKTLQFSSISVAWTCGGYERTIVRALVMKS